MKNDQLDELDEKILRIIGDNARIPFLEVARECNVSGAAIHQRITKLVDTGVILGSKFVFDWSKIGFETTAIIGVTLSKHGLLPEMVEKLKEISEVVECYYSSGHHDIVMKVVTANNKELLRVIRDQIHPLGFSSIETTILFEEIFRRQVPIG